MIEKGYHGTSCERAAAILTTGYNTFVMPDEVEEHYLAFIADLPEGHVRDLAEAAVPADLWGRKWEAAVELIHELWYTHRGGQLIWVLWEPHDEHDAVDYGPAILEVDLTHLEEFCTDNSGAGHHGYLYRSDVIPPDVFKLHHVYGCEGECSCLTT